MGILKKSAVGIEIDSKEIRAVHLTGKPDKPGLCTFARFSLDEGVVKDGKVIKKNELGVALSTMWSRENIKCRDVVLGVNNQDVIVRFASFVKVPGDKLDSMIRFQAQDYIPIPIEEVELGYSVTGEESNAEGSFYNVLLVAGKKKMLFDFISSIQYARLNIVDVGVSMLSFMKHVPDEISDLPIVVLNLSNDFGNIVILDKKEPGMARTFSYNNETTRIINELNNKYADLDFIIDDSRLDSLCSILAGEIRSSVLYYQNQKPGALFRNILLIGGLARIKHLAERLKQLTGTDVTVVSRKNSRINLTVANGFAYRDADYAICTNLAIRGLEV